jgi:hypothetical protein
MGMLLQNKQILSLDSLTEKLTEINNVLLTQNNQIIDMSTQTQKIIHQLRINNMYKAHENDFIIDDNIFENDEID